MQTLYLFIFLPAQLFKEAGFLFLLVCDHRPLLWSHDKITHSSLNYPLSPECTGHIHKKEMNREGTDLNRKWIKWKCTCINTRLHSHTLVCVGFDPLTGVWSACCMKTEKDDTDVIMRPTQLHRQTACPSQTDKSSESSQQQTGPRRERHLSHLSGEIALSLPRSCMSLPPHAPLHLPLTDHPLLSASTQLHYQTTANKDKMSSQLHSSDQSALREEEHSFPVAYFGEITTKML